MIWSIPMKSKRLPQCFLFCLCLLCCGCAPKTIYEYGVFLGINGRQMDRLAAYHIVVIEPAEFSAAQIKNLHENGKIVYGYLNIGALEEYRPYYDQFKNITLTAYENWPDERWINTAEPKWQAFIVDKLGKQYAEMGLDGLFLDNTDVYGLYPTEEIFQGLCQILKGLKAYGLSLIINGGDLFVSRNIDEKTALSLFDGINQESVFTNIQFSNKSYGKQGKEETLYFQKYLAKAKNCGLSVFLLEYNADPELVKKIDAYCHKNGFLWYNAKSLALR